MAAIGAVAPPPYMVAGPDGRSYFKVLNPYLALAETFAHAIAVRRRYLGVPHPEAKAKAKLMTVLIDDLAGQVRAGELAVAAAADRAIVGRIRATKHRPDGRKLLVNSVESRPIATRPFPTAAVGVADIGVLDTAADQQGRPYWRAQEFGSDHLVGKTRYGFFQPGDSAASPLEVGQHPFFVPQRGGPPMRIKNPIRARFFLRGGAADAERFRYRTMTKIAADTIGEIERILVVGIEPGGTRRVGKRTLRRL